MQSPGRTFLLLLLGPLLGLVSVDLVLGLASAWPRFLASCPAGTQARADGLLYGARPGEVDVVVMGSSIAHRNLDEARLERMLGPRRARVLNLGFDGAMAVTMAMMIPDVLDLEPRVVLFVVSPFMLTAREPLTGARAYHPVVAWQMFGPPRSLDGARFHLMGTFGRG